jgi:hypothetical protein
MKFGSISHSGSPPACTIGVNGSQNSRCWKPRTKSSSPPSKDTSTLTCSPRNPWALPTRLRGRMVGVAVGLGVPLVVGVRVGVTVPVCAPARPAATRARTSAAQHANDGARNVILFEVERRTLHQNPGARQRPHLPAT